MQVPSTENKTDTGATRLLVGLMLVAVAALAGVAWLSRGSSPPAGPTGSAMDSPVNFANRNYRPRELLDTAGFLLVGATLPQWDPKASLVTISEAFQRVGYRNIERVDAELADPNIEDQKRASLLMIKAALLNYEGDPKQAYQVLAQGRALVETTEELARRGVNSFIFYQGLTGLRRGENENCILCRGESSCIIPISSSARHTNPEGSSLAIRHFTEYLEQFPNDLEVRWLLNIAHMTLGEHPENVDPRFLVSLDHFLKSDHGIGKFRDIGDKVGVNNIDQAGGAIMEDFDNDGLLDIITTTYDPTSSMTFKRNLGEGHFKNVACVSGLGEMLGGLNCVQTDYNNDGYMDVFVVRGAWLSAPMRPSLLQNNQDGTFTDMTEAANLLYPANSITASWADYDNDGWLDLFVCCERQPSRLHRNLGNGTFQEVAREAGIDPNTPFAKGAAWFDYDNDGDPDLFVNHLSQEIGAQLYRNNGNGTFDEVTDSMGIDGPLLGFSCWAWDYNNDGWLDIFATCYDRNLGEVVKGLLGQPHMLNSNRLFRNQQGQGFQDVTKDVGLDMVFETMGSNFGDFDNDGYLEMYLGTGEPSLATLIPNRMFRNLAGKKFAEITASSGTGNLQKGHAVACGDWDRDGNVDIFIEMGGAIPGDKYHNILFQNPGHDNNWLTIKLIGQKSNRAAIGARIKVVTDGPNPRTFYRHVSSGSSFGANPLQQTIGLGKTYRIALLEIQWPTSKTTQIFKDIGPNQALEITELSDDYRKLDWKPIPVPK